MRRNFDEYKFAKKTMLYLVLVFAIGFSFYYLYDAIPDLFLPDQSQNMAVDPLDDSGNSAKPTESIDSPELYQAQNNLSDVQKDKVLSIIKVNQKISDSQKAQIMKQLGGNIK